MGIRPSNTIFPYHHVFSHWDHARTAPAISCTSTTHGGCRDIGTLRNRVASRLLFRTYRKNSRNVVVEHNSRDATMNSAVAHKAATIFHGRLWGPAKLPRYRVRGHPLGAKNARTLIRPFDHHRYAERNSRSPGLDRWSAELRVKWFLESAVTRGLNTDTTDMSRCHSYGIRPLRVPIISVPTAGRVSAF